MSTLTNALERILNWLQNNLLLEYASLEVLEPGLTYEEIEEMVADLPFRLPQEVYELYQWRNGTCYGEEDFARFFYYRAFLSLESALEKYEELIEDVAYWESDWFPIFEENDNRGYYFIIGDREVKEISPVFSFDWEEPDIEKIYDSLAEMMLKIADDYDTGAYYKIGADYKDET